MLRRRRADAASAIAGMYRAAFGRPPTDDEAGRVPGASWTSRRRATATTADDAEAWADLAHVLINVKEFIFID